MNCWRQEFHFSRLVILTECEPGADVFRLFSNNVGPFTFNLGLRTSLFSNNLGRKRSMLSSQTVYVLKPLHLPTKRLRKR
jgi:hypothetical protein